MKWYGMKRISCWKAIIALKLSFKLKPGINNNKKGFFELTDFVGG